VLVRATDTGLACAAGGFHIDPWRPAQTALITHAHADHARPGSQVYYAAAPGVGLLRKRLGADADIRAVGWGERIAFGETTVSFHPAGHVLGSAQARIERAGEVWVVSGDYKTEPDPTAEPFEQLECDVFITESTFGLPIYRWPEARTVFDEINDWWRGNQRTGRTSVLYAYSLGKAQRLLAGVDPTIGPTLAHGAVDRLLPPFRDAGVPLPEVEKANDENARGTRGRALVVAPPSAGASPWIRKFGRVSDAFASGWMRIRGTRRRRSLDRGFVLSDHCDWPSLLTTIQRTGARRIGVTHGYVRPLVRYLREQGLDAFPIDTRYEGEVDEGADDAEAS